MNKKQILVVNTSAVVGPDYSELLVMLEADGYTVTLVEGLPSEVPPGAKVIDIEKFVERFRPPTPQLPPTPRRTVEEEFPREPRPDAAARMAAAEAKRARKNAKRLAGAGPKPEWPQRIINHLGRAPRVGDWFAECCILDLYQITEVDDLQNLLTHYSEWDTGGTFWINEESARRDLVDLVPPAPAAQVAPGWDANGSPVES